MEEKKHEQDISQSSEHKNAFGLTSEDVNKLFQSLTETIIPAIAQNERRMAQSYESMLNDRTPLI